MSDFTYFVLAMIFNNFKTIVLIVLLFVWWDVANACTIPDDSETIVINCNGCK